MSDPTNAPSLVRDIGDIYTRIVAVERALSVPSGAGGGMSDAEVKVAYEANADTNEFDDAEQSKLAGVEALADVTDATNVAAAGAIMEGYAILGPDGSAAAPSYSFASDTNTGIYSGAANEIFFSTGGTENLRLTGNNIRMASNSSLLYNLGAVRVANGTVSAPGHTFNDDTNTGVYRYAADRLGMAAGGVWRGIFDGTGLYVNGVIRSGYGSVSAPAYSFNGDTNTGMYRHGSDIIGFSTAGSFRAYISSSLFYLYPRILQDSSDADAIKLRSNTNTVGSISKWVQIENNSGTRQGFMGMYLGNMYFWADVGAALIRAGGQNCSYMNGSSVYVYDAYNNASTGGSYVRIDSSGLMHRYSSSRKYKTDFESITDEYADKVLEIEPTFFRSTAWNDNPSYSYYGAIAEDVALIDPRFAEWGPADDCACPEAQERGATWDDHKDDCFVPVSIDYGTFTMHLIQIAKRQRETNKVQADTIGALEQRLYNLEKKVQ